jgi:hypothetical protein
MHPNHTTKTGRHAIDLTGKRFGRLTVIDRAPTPPQAKLRQAHWNCICDCGSATVAGGVHLRKGVVVSCGCRSYGQTFLAEYKVWTQMKLRCANPQMRNYKHYGGRGITVCSRWTESFDNFYADMGPRPTNKHSIDRIDNDGPYSPDNCRWATQDIQMSNRRGNRHLTYNGKTLTITQWAKELGISRTTIRTRLNAGLPPETILSTERLPRK